jgi:hypothetical protein
MAEDAEIEARRKKAERGWIVEPQRPRINVSPGEEVDRWYAVIGLRDLTEPNLSVAQRKMQLLHETPSPSSD